MPVLRHFALQVAIGFGIAVLFLTALLLADPGGVGTLLWSQGKGALALLWLFTGLTFGGVQFAASVGLAAEAPEGGRGTPRRVPVHALVRAVRRPRNSSG